MTDATHDLPHLPDPPWDIRLHPRARKELDTDVFSERLDEAFYFIEQVRLLTHQWMLSRKQREDIAQTVGIRKMRERKPFYEARIETNVSAGSETVYVYFWLHRGTVWVLHASRMGDTRRKLLDKAIHARASRRLRDIEGHKQDQGELFP